MVSPETEKLIQRNVEARMAQLDAIKKVVEQLVGATFPGDIIFGCDIPRVCEDRRTVLMPWLSIFSPIKLLGNLIHELKHIVDGTTILKEVETEDYTQKMLEKLWSGCPGAATDEEKALFFRKQLERLTQLRDDELELAVNYFVKPPQIISAV